MCEEDVLVVSVAELTRTPFTTLEKLAVMGAPRDALERVPLELARELDLVPLGLKGGTQLMVAMKDPMNSAALEQLKTATGLKSVVAVRAGENAIRRTRNRFYLGKEDEVPDWLENFGGAAAQASASGVPLSQRPTPREPSPARVPPSPPVVQGSAMSLEEWGAPPPSLGASLESPAGRLVEGLLTLLGERGKEAKQLSSLAVALAVRLGVEGAEHERVRFAATALAVANFIDGRPAHDVPTIASLSAVLGEATWNELEPLVTVWLEWPAPHPGQPAAQAVAAAFAFSAHAGLPRPTGNRLAGAFVSFKARFKLEAEPLDALARELNLPAGS
jgi:hypothetical protein